jgi:dUTP pyrophosphatase
MNQPMAEIKILNHSANPLPAYETEGAAGMDLRAFLPEPIVLKPFERALVPTGLFMEIPSGFEAQIRPRSGLAFKQGITCLNSPGTIDSDYRGEIKVLLINLDNQPHEIKNAERIAQMVISPVTRAVFSIVHQLEESERGSGGFGHTGKH